MPKIKFDVKMIESCITCEYSESNYNLNIFHCNKYNLDLAENGNRPFHKDCKLLDSNNII